MRASMRARTNWGVNFLPQGRAYVVERFGKYYETSTAGLKLLWPFVDRIAYVVPLQEMCLRIDPQRAITLDNCVVVLGGNVYLRVTDATKAAYGAQDTLYAVQQHAQSAMRAKLGSMTMDAAFRDRDGINTTILSAMSEATEAWGCEVLRFEVTALEPADKAVTESLHKQATAERDKRQAIKNAEADKARIELEAQAYAFDVTTRARAKNEADVASAEAAARIAVVAAQAEADALRTVKQAEADGVRLVSAAARDRLALVGHEYDLAVRGVDALHGLARAATFVVGANPVADVATLVATAKQAWGGGPAPAPAHPA